MRLGFWLATFLFFVPFVFSFTYPSQVSLDSYFSIEGNLAFAPDSCAIVFLDENGVVVYSHQMDVVGRYIADQVLISSPNFLAGEEYNFKLVCYSEQYGTLIFEGNFLVVGPSSDVVKMWAWLIPEWFLINAPYIFSLIFAILAIVIVVKFLLVFFGVMR